MMIDDMLSLRSLREPQLMSQFVRDGSKWGRGSCLALLGDESDYQGVEGCGN